MIKGEKIAWAIVYIGLIIFGVLIIGIIITPRDVLVRETDNELYYKEYTLFGLDSVYHKYHKPIRYEGVVSDKSDSSYMVGVAGKGRHRHTEYKTTVRYNGKAYICDDSWVYEEYNKGDKIIVTETFYPRHKINFEHKWKKKIENY